MAIINESEAGMKGANYRLEVDRRAAIRIALVEARKVILSSS
jgi:hypothetical protein